MKKIYIPLLTLLLVMTLSLAACSRRAGPLPDNPFDKEDEVDLPVQSFNNALDAYNFGKTYFEQEAKYYETVTYGTAHPLGTTGDMAGDQINGTRRYLSSNGDFMYDTANFSLKNGMFDTSFSFISAMPASGSDIYYKKINGKSNITRAGSELLVSYAGQSLSTLVPTSMDNFKNTCGINPRELLNYVINEDTIIAVKSFNAGGSDYHYTFAFELNSSAHQNYKRWVSYTSGYPYDSFGHLTLEFGMDKYGRILKISIDEKYSVEGPLGAQTIELTLAQYLTFSKKPVLNFNGFTVTYENSATAG